MTHSSTAAATAVQNRLWGTLSVSMAVKGAATATVTSQTYGTAAPGGALRRERVEKAAVHVTSHSTPAPAKTRPSAQARGAWWASRGLSVVGELPAVGPLPYWTAVTAPRQATSRTGLSAGKCLSSGCGPG
ncbi:hypothetical protein [Streptomyces virginiae]|uniref:hypothetical protein n=1 Tax=Streptomyces virginiae TaxID=1961 RepID=UPI0036FC4750